MPSACAALCSVLSVSHLQTLLDPAVTSAGVGWCFMDLAVTSEKIVAQRLDGTHSFVPRSQLLSAASRCGRGFVSPGAFPQIRAEAAGQILYAGWRRIVYILASERTVELPSVNSFKAVEAVR
jgi:hypothetical protein